MSWSPGNQADFRKTKNIYCLRGELVVIVLKLQSPTSTGIKLHTKQRLHNWLFLVSNNASGTSMTANVSICFDGQSYLKCASVY